MKNKVLTIILFVILISGMLLALTGCGKNNQSNDIVNDLNTVIDEAVASWKENGYGVTLSIYYIQNSLDKKDLPYVIVASGDKAFTSKPDFTEYKENNIPNYDGESYDNVRMLEENTKVKYCIVYNKDSNKYYNVEINYEKADVNNAKFEYTVFSNATELK